MNASPRPRRRRHAGGGVWGRSGRPLPPEDGLSAAGRHAGPWRKEARAFVLGLGANGLGAVRSLGEVGVPVTGIEVAGVRGRLAPGLSSRYCDVIACPSPTTEPDRVLELLLAESRRLGEPPVLIPTTDGFVQFMSRHRDAVGRGFRFALPPPALVEALLNKRVQYELAERIGVPYPQTFYPAHAADVARIRDAVQYPALLKPYHSHRWQPVFGNKGFPVDGPAALEARFAEVLPSGLPVMVQSVIPGPNTNHYLVRAYIDAAGRLLAFLTARKIRQYPVDFGNATLLESVRLEEVERLALRLFRGLDYRGIGTIEFKRDERDGQLRLIELNTRLPQNHIHCTRCGVNLPLIAYLDLTGQRPPPQTAYREGVRYLDAAQDFRAFLAYHRQGRLGIVEWLRSIARARAFAYFDWRDPLPFLVAGADGVRHLARTLGRGRRARA